MRLAFLEDDAPLSARVTRILTEDGHQITHFIDAESIIRGLRDQPFDLLILDWILPESSGLDVLRWARDNLDPVPATIMLTSRTSEAEIVAGLSSGADDYILKPVQESILKARVAALLRRVEESREKPTIEAFGVYEFDTRNHVVKVDGAVVPTTKREFDLALLMFHNLGRPLSRKYIFEKIWRRHPDAIGRTLETHVSQVRTRLRIKPENGFRLSSVYNFGYRLERIEAIARIVPS